MRKSKDRDTTMLPEEKKKDCSFAREATHREYHIRSSRERLRCLIKADVNSLKKGATSFPWELQKRHVLEKRWHRHQQKYGQTRIKDVFSIFLKIRCSDRPWHLNLKREPQQQLNRVRILVHVQMDRSGRRCQLSRQAYQQTD